MGHFTSAQTEGHKQAGRVRIFHRAKIIYIVLDLSKRKSDKAYFALKMNQRIQ